MKEVIHNDTVLARFGDTKDLKNGWNFFSADSDVLQYGFGQFNDGEVMLPHIHKVRSRPDSAITQEFVYVISGAVEVCIYTIVCELFYTQTLGIGDWVAFLEGGHSLKVMQKDTLMLEVKNGPFVSVDADKIRFQRV